MSDVTNDTTAQPTPAGLHRRRFLLGTGVVGAGALLAACGGDDDDAGVAETGSSSTTSGEEESTTSTTGNGDASGDAAVAGLAASLEVLAVNTYGAALEAATSGALGDVPPAVAEFVTTAQGHHQAHLDAWNEVLTSAGQDEVDAPPADLEQTVNDMFASVTDVAGAARLALLLEDTAAATYLSAIPTLQSGDAVQLAGSICCVDRQHAAVLRFVLGEYPVPEVFGRVDMAYSG